MTKKSFQREINVLSHTRPKKKVTEIIAAVLKAEHDKIVSSKNTNKSGGQSKKSNRQKKVRDHDSDSNKSGESIHAMDESDDGQTVKDSLDEENSYQRKIKNLGAILDNKWQEPVETNNNSDNKNKYTNECYVSAAKLFRQTKKQKTKHVSSITLGLIYNRKGERKLKDQNAFECYSTQVAVDP